MYLIFETQKTFEEACRDLERAIPKQEFSLQHVHNIGQTLRSKGQDFKEECCVFEMCNPSFAAQVLALDLRMNMALPCRASIYTETNNKGRFTKIGMIPPSRILMSLSQDLELQAIAEEVERRMVAILKSIV